MTNAEKMQNHLNEHQYNRKAYLSACAADGLDMQDAREFCNQVYGALQSENHGGNGWMWALLLLLLALPVAGIWWAVATFIVPNMP